MPKSEEEKLIDQVGQHMCAMFAASVSRIGDAIDNEEARQASFTVTATFKKTKKGKLKLRIMPRERVPMPGVELTVELEDGQLSLLRGTGEPRPVQPGADMGEGEDETPAESPATH